MIKYLYIFREVQIKDREILLRLIKTYNLSGLTPQPASSNLRNIARIIAARESGRKCVEDLTEYLLLNGIPVGDRRP